MICHKGRCDSSLVMRIREKEAVVSPYYFSEIFTGYELLCVRLGVVRVDIGTINWMTIDVVISYFIYFTHADPNSPHHRCNSRRRVKVMNVLFPGIAAATMVHDQSSPHAVISPT